MYERATRPPRRNPGTDREIDADRRTTVARSDSSGCTTSPPAASSIRSRRGDASRVSSTPSPPRSLPVGPWLDEFAHRHGICDPCPSSCAYLSSTGRWTFYKAAPACGSNNSSISRARRSPMTLSSRNSRSSLYVDDAVVPQLSAYHRF